MHVESREGKGEEKTKTESKLEALLQSRAERGLRSGFWMDPDGNLCCFLPALRFPQSFLLFFPMWFMCAFSLFLFSLSVPVFLSLSPPKSHSLHPILSNPPIRLSFSPHPLPSLLSPFSALDHTCIMEKSPQDCPWRVTAHTHFLG